MQWWNSTEKGNQTAAFNEEHKEEAYKKNPIIKQL